MMRRGLEEYTSNTLLALSAVRPHLVEGAVSNVYGTQNTD